MGKLRVKMNIAGCIAFRNSSEIQQEVLNVCDKVATNAQALSSDGAAVSYKTDVQQGKTRAIGRVTASNRAARSDNSENNTLVKALKNTKV